ncbi:TPA: relaxase domain-containing protein [Escherichia coli]|nr:relaxase domain-containing protein [Escherichia coli]
MMSIAQVRSAGSAGNYYTDKDNYYVLGSMGERWAGQGAEQLGLQGSVDKDVFRGNRRIRKKSYAKLTVFS